jgi:hypothetical protein
MRCRVGVGFRSRRVSDRGNTMNFDLEYGGTLNLGAGSDPLPKFGSATVRRNPDTTSARATPKKSSIPHGFSTQHSRPAAGPAGAFAEVIFLPCCDGLV